MSDELKSRLTRYLQKADQKFSTITITADPEKATLLIDSARRYLHDAHHFEETGDPISALAALEYAEGWVDAARALDLISCEHTGELE